SSVLLLFSISFYYLFCFVLLLPRPPRSTLFPYTTLFRSVIRITRIAIGAISVFVLVLTWLNPPEFLSIFLYLGLSGIGSAIAVPLFASLMWPKKATKQGALASCIIGPLAYILFEMILNWNMWFSSMLAVILAGIAMFVLSIICKPKEVVIE